MPQYPVLEPLGFDRVKPYLPGDTVAMTAEEAVDLIATGIIGEAVPGTENARLNVADTVKLVQAATTIEEIDNLAEGETRKGVLEVITSRRAELEAAKG